MELALCIVDACVQSVWAHAVSGARDMFAQTALLRESESTCPTTAHARLVWHRTRAASTARERSCCVASRPRACRAPATLHAHDIVAYDVLVPFDPPPTEHEWICRLLQCTP